jgi:hypothetical protein
VTFKHNKHCNYSPVVKGRLVPVLKLHTAKICGEEELKPYRILILAMNGNA